MTNNEQHTPGPWRLDQFMANVVIDGGGTVVAGVADSPVSENMTKANLNLITAAPELLEALESACECIRVILESDEYGNDKDGLSIYYHYEGYQKAIKAIKKARGE